MEIRGPRNVGGIRPVGAKPLRATGPGKEIPGPDRTDSAQISELAQIKSKLISVPEVRSEKVATVRKAIQEGTYETAEKIDATVSKLLEG